MILIISTLFLKIIIFDLNDIAFTVKEKITEVVIAYPAGTGSMLPLIQPDSKIIYSFDISELRDGNIIIFNDCNNEDIVHRIYSTLKIQNKIYYVTKGDANDEIDNCLISKEMIDGRVIRIE